MKYFADVVEAANAWAELEYWLDASPYTPIFEDIKRKGYKTVYDIGSGFGPHIGRGLDKGFRYIGIDSDESPIFWDCRSDVVDYDTYQEEGFVPMWGKEVPFDGFVPESGSCAISVCALGSLYHSAEDIDKQMEFLTSHFKDFWCTTFPESLEKMKKHWKGYEVIGKTPHSIDPVPIIHFYN